MICKSAMIPDATSGRDSYEKILHRMHVCKISMCTYVKNETCIKHI